MLGVSEKLWVVSLFDCSLVPAVCSKIDRQLTFASELLSIKDRAFTETALLQFSGRCCSKWEQFKAQKERRKHKVEPPR